MLTGHRRAHTILETVVATFILAGSMLALLALFDSGVRNLQSSALMSRSLLVAESNLEKVRAWCQVPAHFHQPESYPNLGVFQSQQGLESRMELERTALYSPDWGSELLWPASDRRQLPEAVLTAVATVRWGLGKERQVRLTGTIAEPNCGWNSNPIRIQMTPTGTSVAQGESRELTAEAYDQSNRPMPNVTFSWTVIACTRDGSLQNQSRDGHRARFVHRLPKPGGGFGFGPAGEVWVQATGRFWGVEKSEKVVLNLL